MDVELLTEEIEVMTEEERAAAFEAMRRMHRIHCQKAYAAKRQQEIHYTAARQAELRERKLSAEAGSIEAVLRQHNEWNEQASTEAQAA